MAIVDTHLVREPQARAWGADLAAGNRGAWGTGPRASARQYAGRCSLSS